jgi:hypothetical protein
MAAAARSGVSVAGSADFTGLGLAPTLSAAGPAVTSVWMAVQYVAPKIGEMPAIVRGASAERPPGQQPTHDLKAGRATARPEFSETAK